MVCSIFAIAIMYESNLIAKIAGQALPAEMDPTRRVHAWKLEASLVETAREKLAAEGNRVYKGAMRLASVERARRPS